VQSQIAQQELLFTSSFQSSLENLHVSISRNKKYPPRGRWIRKLRHKEELKFQMRTYIFSLQPNKVILSNYRKWRCGKKREKNKRYWLVRLV
jgi:hypothetical protein